MFSPGVCSRKNRAPRLCLDVSSRSTWDYANGTIDLHKQHRETVGYTITRVLWPYDENPRACSTSRRVFYPYANPSPTRGIPRLALDSSKRIDEGKTKVATLLRARALSLPRCNVLVHQSDHYSAAPFALPILGLPSPSSSLRFEPLSSSWMLVFAKLQRQTLSRNFQPV